MLGNELLTDRYRYKWLILRYIENYKNHFCTLFNLSNILEISSYKVERYLEEINDDLKLIGSDSSVSASSRIEQLTPINFEHFRSQTCSDDVSFGS